MAGKIVKLEVGTVYQKNTNGTYYFRYQINGQRKAVSLKTKNQKEAIKKAQELVPVVKSTTTEMISAHVKHARDLAKCNKSLPLENAWEVYSKHPEKATPTTIAEEHSYRATLNEFVDFLDNRIHTVDAVTAEIAFEYANFLKQRNLSVGTHNRKMRHIKKIFEVLKDYRNKENPFIASSLRRKPREEQEHIVRRISFTPEQTQQLLEALEDDSNKVMNKPEIRVIYHLGMFTGQRLKDCVLLRWDKVDFKRKRIEVKQFKTGKEVSIPMAAQLFDVLKEAQSWKENQYVCPNVAKRYNKLDKNGKNVGNNLVNIDVLRVIKWIGLEPSVEVPGRKKKVTVYGFHSLRHSFASHCAEAGVPKAVVISILGANSEIVDKHYTHIGEEAQEKAIHSLFGTANTISNREKIEKALAMFAAWEDKPEQAVEIENILQT